MVKYAIAMARMINREFTLFSEVVWRIVKKLSRSLSTTNNLQRARAEKFKRVNRNLHLWFVVLLFTAVSNETTAQGKNGHSVSLGLNQYSISAGDIVSASNHLLHPSKNLSLFSGYQASPFGLSELATIQSGASLKIDSVLLASIRFGTISNEVFSRLTVGATVGYRLSQQILFNVGIEYGSFTVVENSSLVNPIAGLVAIDLSAILSVAPSTDVAIILKNISGSGKSDFGYSLPQRALLSLGQTIDSTFAILAGAEIVSHQALNLKMGFNANLPADITAQVLYSSNPQSIQAGLRVESLNPLLISVVYNYHLTLGATPLLELRYAM